MKNENTTAKQLTVSACIVKSTTPAILTKTRALNNTTGAIITQANGNYPAGSLIEGTAENVTFTSMSELASVLDTATTDMALIAAKHAHSTPKVRLMSKARFNELGQPSDAITRTKDNFTRTPGAQGLLILDCDNTNISKDEFINAIRSVIPNLYAVAHAYTTSSSSWLYVNGELAQGDKGKRLYLVISDASDIERAGMALFDRLWLAGYGHYEIGRAGQYLNRGIIDTAMFKDTCRLDFISGSNCIEPVTQQRPPAEANEGQPLDTITALPPLTESEAQQLAEMQQHAKQLLASQAQAVKASYCTAKGLEMLKAQGNINPAPEELEQAKTNVLKALESDTLTGDFTITLKNGDQITVNELLANAERYDGSETLDPLEPDYNNYSVTGKLFLDSNASTLHSFAHGGKTYKLVRQSRFIKHQRGATAETTTATLKLLRQLPEFYDLGRQLVTVRGGHVQPMTESLLSYELGITAQYYTERKNKNGDTEQNHIDPPTQVVKQLISMGCNTGNGTTQRGLKPLKAVINAPTITPGGHVISKPGYDRNTGLYLANSAPIEVQAGKPTIEQLRASYELINAFVSTWALKRAIDKSAVISAMLTAVVRPAIDKAPIFCFDAPTQGSGKTYLAECIGLLATGQAPAITPAIQGNEAEIQKTLLSMLMNGARVIVWDNIMGRFNSATMAAFTTAVNYSGRVLGASEQIELPNKALTLFTGNNLNLHGDLPRRCITARIDTGEENPLNTVRDLSALGGLKPDTYLANNSNRMALINACITIIKSYLMSDLHMAGKRYTPTAVASFEEWDTMARQPLLHLKHMGIAPELADVKDSIDNNMANDSEKETLSILLANLYRFFGEQPFTARDVMNVAYDFIDMPNRGEGHELAELFQDMLGKRVNSRSVGRIITNRLDRVADKMRLVEVQNSGKHAKRYRIQLVS